MDAEALRQRVIKSLLAEITDVQFPSVTMMNRVESTLRTPEDLAEYAEALVEKIEASHYPSIPMLNRLDALLDRLEQMERSERGRHLEAA
jgi:hypothetical protein